jgi:hypothetical protein
MLGYPEGSLERLILEAEADALDEEERLWWLAQAWQCWVVESCAERGGHWWWLTIDPDDGLHLACLHCPAGVDNLLPGGDNDLLAGTFTVMDRYELTLDTGEVLVNMQHVDDLFTYGWQGLVKASIRVEKYGGYFEPAEYGVWIDLEPA